MSPNARMHRPSISLLQGFRLARPATNTYEDTYTVLKKELVRSISPKTFDNQVMTPMSQRCQWMWTFVALCGPVICLALIRLKPARQYSAGKFVLSRQEP